MLSRTEKEQRVIELYQQGKTIREIAQEVHMSFGDIGSIIRKVTGLDGDGDKPKEQKQVKAPITTLSKDSQAFKLFSEGKKPIDVVIELDLKAEEALYRKYWELNQLHQLTLLFPKIKHYIPSFLKLHSIMRDNGMDQEKDIVNAIKYANQLPYLENKVQQLMCDVGVLESKKNSCRTAFFALQKQISEEKDSLKFYQSILDDKIQNISHTHEKLSQLENIKNGNKDYQEIERLAEQKANDIFSNKKAILAAAIMSVLAALRNDRNKQFLIYGLFSPSTDADAILSYTRKMMSSANPENYLQFNQRKLLEIVEAFYDRLLKVAVNNTIYTPLSNSASQTKSGSES